MSKKLPELKVKSIQPITDHQKSIFSEFEKGKHLFINGSAGTGKTFVSLYLALKELYMKPVAETDIYGITIIRSAVPTRDIGFLPGDLETKTAVYEEPYRSIVDDLFERKVYDELKKQGHVNFMTTSYLRGLTIDHNIVIVDEMQNMTEHEIDSIMTRIGNSSRVIFCGDFMQSDLVKLNDKRAMFFLMDIVDRMGSFAHIEMNEDDIVRSGLVRDFIIMRNKLYVERNSNNAKGVQLQPAFG